MAFSQDYLDFVLEQFTELDGISYKKKFGGVGIYKDGLMFAGIMNGTLHLKVDYETRQDFIDRGMEPFFYKKTSKILPKYYDVPIEIMEDRDILKLWAEKAYAAALRAKK